MLSDVGMPELMGPILDVKLHCFSLYELQVTAKKLKLGKACGVDEVPGEYWKVALEDGFHPLAEWIFHFVIAYG